MSNIPSEEIRREFAKSKIGLIGIAILIILGTTSVATILFIPTETLKEWNNPQNWLSLPKTASPSWTNWFLAEKIPEHRILDNPSIETQQIDEISLFREQFVLDYNFDDYPSDFIYDFTAEYSGSPLLQISVIRPDGLKLEFLSMSLPYGESVIHNERIFSTDITIKKNLYIQSEKFGFQIEGLSPETIIFSESQNLQVLKGRYVFLINFLGISDKNKIIDSELIIGGKTFGMMGTDDLRRDLAIGLLWGTPLALFVGISVAVGSVTMGLLYGVYAGFKGKKTDEAMMRFNDVIYALPALPFLIILAATISNSIFVIIGFLMIFGWVGVAKVSRSMSLQIKTRQYVEAAKIMGQKNSKIIFKHIIPQLLPYAFASIAISVPAAITTEAGLSFLGLGDPTYPTWGQILNDASTYGAAARGLWWWIVPPGIMIAITGLSFVFIGNALDSIVNPKLKR